MRTRYPLIPLCLALLAVCFSPGVARAGLARAGEVGTEALTEALVRAEEAEGGRLSDHTLTDQDGVSFGLHDYFRGERPLVMGFIFTSCPHVCPTITRSLKKAVDGAREELGDVFNVLIIGFDTERDSPEKLKEYALRHIEGFEGSSIRFATADAETIGKLTEEAGFFFSKRDDGGFDHLDMAAVLTPDGKLYRQVFGLRSGGELVGTRLGELIKGEPAVERPLTLVERIKFLCSRYDPYTGEYVVEYYVFLGVILQFLVMVLIVRAVWGRRISAFFKRLLTGKG